MWVSWSFFLINISRIRASTFEELIDQHNILSRPSAIRWASWILYEKIGTARRLPYKRTGSCLAAVLNTTELCPCLFRIRRPMENISLARHYHHTRLNVCDNLLPNATSILMIVLNRLPIWVFEAATMATARPATYHFPVRDNTNMIRVIGQSDLSDCESPNGVHRGKAPLMPCRNLLQVPLPFYVLVSHRLRYNPPTAIVPCSVLDSRGGGTSHPNDNKPTFSLKQLNLAVHRAHSYCGKDACYWDMIKA